MSKVLHMESLLLLIVPKWEMEWIQSVLIVTLGLCEDARYTPGLSNSGYSPSTLRYWRKSCPDYEHHFCGFSIRGVPAPAEHGRQKAPSLALSFLQYHGYSKIFCSLFLPSLSMPKHRPAL